MRLHNSFGAISKRIRERHSKTPFMSICVGKLEMLVDDLKQFETGYLNGDRAILVKHFSQTEKLNKALEASKEDMQKRLANEKSRIGASIEKKTGGEQNSEYAAELRQILRGLSPVDRLTEIAKAIKNNDTHMIAAVSPNVPDLLIGVSGESERAAINKIIREGLLGAESGEMVEADSIGNLVIRMLEDAMRETERYLKQTAGQVEQIKQLTA